MRKQRVIFVLFCLAFWGMNSCESSDTTSSKSDETQETSQSENGSETSNIESEKEEEGQQSAKISIPKGYIVFDSIRGDLNGDGQNDRVYIVKGTDPKNWEMNQFDEKVDRNRRGILVYVTNDNGLQLVTENLDCFSSENEDGGVYFPPELTVEIKKGKLFVNYGHGRYGYWSYNFRYQEGKMKLIGFDRSENMGPIVHHSSSYNFLSGKKLEKENINFYSDNPENEVFKETWSDLPKKQLISLSSIEDFDGLSF